MSDSSDVQLQLKKRARRRLVGAVAFAGLAAVILPMVMDEEPKQQVQDVQIRIPGQEQSPFKPRIRPAAEMAEVKADTQEKSRERAESSPPVPARPADAPARKLEEKTAEKPVAKPVEKTSEKPVEKTTEMTPAKPAEKQAEKAVEKADKASEAQRAAAMLAGKSVADSAPSHGGGPFVILIGAFSNPANVKQLQTKIGELGVKVYTEPLDAPDGRKTRVRAGPFPNREAADKALDKMKRIGVNGVVAARQ